MCVCVCVFVCVCVCGRNTFNSLISHMRCKIELR